MTTAPTIDTPPKINQQRQYAVILWNTETVAWPYVVDLLQEIFRKDEQTADAITREVDTEGRAVAGIYDLELAELKRDQVQTLQACEHFGGKIPVSLEKQ